MGLTTKRPTAEDVERLTGRIQKLEARLASMVADLNRMKEAPPGGNGGPPAAGSNETPVRFTDPREGPPASVVLLPRAVVAAGADRLREVFDERGELLEELRRLRRRRKAAIGSHRHWVAVKRGRRRGFAGSPVRQAGEPDREEIEAQLARLDQEVEELNKQIQATEDRLREIYDEVRREWVPVRLGAPVIDEAIPKPTVRAEGE